MRRIGRPARAASPVPAVKMAVVCLAALGVLGCRVGEEPDRSAPKGANSKERVMSDEIRINRIVEMRADTAKVGRLIVATDASGELLLDAEQVEEDVIPAVQSAFSGKRLVALRFDPKSRHILDVYPPLSDLVLALSEQKGEEPGVLVHLMMRPSLCLLPNSHPRFKELQARLGEALAARTRGTRAVVAVLPGESAIQDVRLVPPESSGGR